MAIDLLRGAAVARELSSQADRLNDIANHIATLHDLATKERKRHKTVVIDRMEFSYVLLNAESDLNAAAEIIRDVLAWSASPIGTPDDAARLAEKIRTLDGHMSQVFKDVAELRSCARML